MYFHLPIIHILLSSNRQVSDFAYVFVCLFHVRHTRPTSQARLPRHAMFRRSNRHGADYVRRYGTDSIELTAEDTEIASRERKIQAVQNTTMSSVIV